MSNELNNNTGSNDQNNNNGGDETAKLFISQVEFDKMIQQLQKDIKEKTNYKLINNFASHIPKKAIKKMNKWLGSAHSLLSTNKTARAYHLNTMLDKDTSAQGITKNIDVSDTEPNGCTNVRSHSDGLKLEFDNPSNSVNNGENIGFPVVQEKINELLTERLTDSIGKQSPTSGKVYDLRSIINANTLPVFKNGSIGYMHRIVETLLHLYLYNSSYNVRNTSARDQSYEVYVDVFGPDDLEYYSTRQTLESRQTFTNLSVVSKAINSGDLTVDILRWAISMVLLRADNYGKTNQAVPGTSKLHVYAQAPPITQLPVYTLMNDISYTKSKYFSFPASWIKATPTSSATQFYYYENRTWYKITASNAAVWNYFNEGTHDLSVLSSAGSITIEDTEYTWTSVKPPAATKLSDWYSYRPLKYTVMENVQDIINAIYILAYVTCIVSYRSGSSGSTIDKSLCWTSVAKTSGSLRYVARVATCSIYSRIAQVYGQIKYLDNVEYAVPTESELSNKVFNLGYYIAGLYAKDANKRYGSFETLERYMPHAVKNCWIQGIRCVPYDIDEKEIQIPLNYIVDKSDDAYNLYDEQDYTISDIFDGGANIICYTEYFTEASWWRYDYFGGYEISAPKQEITVNTVDRKFDETYNAVFMNVGSNKALPNVTGQAMIRWTPDGNFQSINFAVRSLCLNTAVKFVIPSIYKNKNFVTALKLHGLDLITVAHEDPIWYAPYNAEAELVDDGSFDQKMLDALFD